MYIAKTRAKVEHRQSDVTLFGIQISASLIRDKEATVIIVPESSKVIVELFALAVSKKLIKQ